jgi:hypothetical protein
MKRKFKKGDIVVMNENRDRYSAKKGSLAVVTSCDNKWLRVEWLSITKHLSHGQMDGGYDGDWFDLVSPSAETTEKEILLKEIDYFIDRLSFPKLKERLMKVLGEMDEDILKNTLRDLKSL